MIRVDDNERAMGNSSEKIVLEGAEDVDIQRL